MEFVIKTKKFLKMKPDNTKTLDLQQGAFKYLELQKVIVLGAKAGLLDTKWNPRKMLPNFRGTFQIYYMDLL